MGVFDWVKYKDICGICGKDLIGFQTKSSGCTMAEIEPTEVDSFYTSCSCGAWVDYTKKDEYHYNDGIDRGFTNRKYVKTTRKEFGGEIYLTEGVII